MCRKKGTEQRERKRQREKNKQRVNSQRFRKRRIGRVREFNERIPSDRRNKPISSADQIEVWAAGAAPLLAEEEESSWCLVL